MKANGILRMAVTVAILGGVALAGFALDAKGPPLCGVERGRLYVGAAVILVALVGFLVTRFGSYQLVFAIVGSVHVIAALTLRGMIRIPKRTPQVLKECYEA